MSVRDGRRDQLRALAQRLGINPVTDIRVSRRGGVQQFSPGSSPESGGTTTTDTSPSTNTDDTVTPDRGNTQRARIINSMMSPADSDDINFSEDDMSFANDSDIGGRNSERGALHKALAMSRQDNRALRAQIERMRSREMEIVTLGVQAQTQISGAAQQLEGLKKRVRQELCHPVDEELYQKLVTTPESELDLFDTIRVAVYQQLGELQASRDRAVRELNDAASRYQDSEEFAKKARFEMDQLVRQHQHEVSTLEDRIEILTKRCEHLELSAKTAALTLDANESKAARFDSVEAELRRTSAASASADEERSRLNGKVSHLTSDLTATRDELQRERLLLHNTQTELKFSSRECERMSARVADLEGQLRRTTDQLDELRSTHTTHGAVIGVEREELRASYEKQLEAATKRLKDGYEADLARVREMTQDAAQRECALLREARDNATTEASQARQQLAALEMEHTSVKDGHREKLDALERELFEMRIEIANKTNDARRHDLSAQESAAEIQRLRTGRDCLQKKLDLLKQEFYDTRAQYQQQITALQAKVEGQEGQLEMFKSLETEAEVFMQHLATSESSNDMAGVRALLDVPSSRRAAHTISVTKRCLALENQVSLLKHEAGVAEVKHSKAAEELARARAALQESNSPYLLLEEGITQRDEEISRLRDRVKITEEELSAAMKRAQCLAQDVQVLTAHRTEVLRLRDALRSGGALPPAPTLASPMSPVSPGDNNPPATQQQQGNRRQQQFVDVVADEGHFEFHF